MKSKFGHKTEYRQSRFWQHKLTQKTIPMQCECCLLLERSLKSCNFLQVKILSIKTGRKANLTHDEKVTFVSIHKASCSATTIVAHIQKHKPATGTFLQVYRFGRHVTKASVGAKILATQRRALVREASQKEKCAKNNRTELSGSELSWKCQIFFEEFNKFSRRQSICSKEGWTRLMEWKPTTNGNGFCLLEVVWK